MVDRPKRQVAYKIRIGDILKSSYLKREGWQPNVISIANKDVSRVNLIATVVSKPLAEQNFLQVVVDDGTGKIALRSFEEPTPISSVDIGDIVLVVGRIREYGNEKYILPEIIKKIGNPKWIDVRRLELGEMATESDQTIYEGGPEERQKTSMSGTILAILQKCDLGDGVDTQQVVEQLPGESCEETIEQLLKEGEIFEIRPGRLKLLR